MDDLFVQDKLTFILLKDEIYPTSDFFFVLGDEDAEGRGLKKEEGGVQKEWHAQKFEYKSSSEIAGIESDKSEDMLYMAESCGG